MSLSRGSKCGIYACSDDESEPGDDGLRFEVNQERRRKAERLAVDAGKVPIVDSNLTKEDIGFLDSNLTKEDIEVDADWFAFEEEEYGLGRPKKRKTTAIELSAAETKKELKERATRKWLPIILHDSESSMAGRRLAKAGPDKQLELLRIYVVKKSGNTLINRVGPVLKYFTWTHLPEQGGDGWPPDEESVVQYIDRTFNEATAKTLVIPIWLKPAARQLFNHTGVIALQLLQTGSSVRSPCPSINRLFGMSAFKWLLVQLGSTKRFMVYEHSEHNLVLHCFHTMNSW